MSKKSPAKGELGKNDAIVLRIFRDLGMANLTQVAAILCQPEKRIMPYVERLTKAGILMRIGKPKLPTHHPLFGSYYGCKRSDLAASMVTYYKPVALRISHHVPANTRFDDLIFQLHEREENTYTRFACHRAWVNFTAAWIIHFAYKKWGVKIQFEGEHIIRNHRKWFQTKAPPASFKGDGTAHPVPDYILKRDGKMMCVEVELQQKSDAYYTWYHDLFSMDTTLLYLVRTEEIGKTLMSFVHKNQKAGYVVIGHNDGLAKELGRLLG